MTVFRISFEDLRTQAREEGTFLYKNPRGLKWEQLKSDKRYGNFVLLSEKPVTIRYGNIVYTITRDYVEIDIPASEYEGIEARDIFISSRIGATLGTLGMVSVGKILHRVKRHKWIDGELKPFPRSVLDTDAFGRAFPLVLYEYPHLKRIVRYIFVNPYISETNVIKRMSELIGITPREVLEHIVKAKTEGYVSEVVYESYPAKYWILLATKIVKENEGKLSFTQLQTELANFALTRREAFDTIFLALEDALIDIKRGRYYTTRKGLRQVKKLPKPKIKKGLRVSDLGRRYMMRK